MIREAVLLKTSNNKITPYIGRRGYLAQENDGCFLFSVCGCEHAIKTSPVPVENIDSGIYIGGLNHPRCDNISFTTKSGSFYLFRVKPIERVIDGVIRA